MRTIFTWDIKEEAVRRGSVSVLSMAPPRLAVLLLAVLLTSCGESQEPAAVASNEQATQAPAEPAGRSGEDVYNSYCFSCHASGLSGAPKHRDADAWAPRLAKGDEALLQSTIEGMPPGMPPRGMCFDCSNEEYLAAIRYMSAP